MWFRPLTNLKRRSHCQPFAFSGFVDQTNFYRSAVAQCNEPRIHRALYQTRVDPNTLSFSDYANLLQSCVSRRAFEHGRQIHAQLCLSGQGSNVILWIKHVNLYSNCNALGYAHHLFDKMPKRNLFFWNVLIRGYAWDGPYKAYVSLYYDLLDHGALEPNNFTFPFVLKACLALFAIKQGKKIHEHVVRTGWDKDVFVGAALIDMYAKCGCVDNAREVFEKISMRDVVLWNSMLDAYVQNGHPDGTLALCREIAFSRVRPRLIMWGCIFCHSYFLDHF